MKHIVLILIFGMFSEFCVSQNSPNKYALLVVIADYPSATGWETLSTMNDLNHLSKALKIQGFADANILQVVNQKATRTGILDGFTKLIDRIKPNDIVLIHFSCHGYRIEADSKNQIDGYDECIVPFGALYESKVNANDSVALKLAMDGYIRGHVFGEQLRRVRAKLGKGGDLSVFLDFCNSGGATRGAHKVRGGSKPLVSKQFEPKKYRKSDSSLLIRSETVVANNSNDLSPYVVFSATRPEELCTETDDEKGKPIGPLSFAFYNLLRAPTKQYTYRSLFADIQGAMQASVPEQHPMIEGTGTDKKIFGGAFVLQTPFIEIDSIINSKILVAKAGKLSGLGESATIKLFNAGTLNPDSAKMVTEGTVISANNYTARIELDQPIDLKLPPAALWAFVKDRTYDINPVNIYTNNNNSEALNEFKTAHLVNNISDADLIWLQGNQMDSLLVASNGMMFAEIKNSSNKNELIKQKIKNYAQYRFIQSLETAEPGVSVEVKLVPVINGIADTNFIGQKTVNGIIEFAEGDTITLAIHNTGKKIAYVNVLDLQPDGIIGVILPKKNSSTNGKTQANELVFMPDQIFIYDPSVFRIILRKPYGTELFKVFASSKLIDLEKTATNGKSNNYERGNQTALEYIMQSSYQGATSRGASEKADGTTSNIFFRIKPASN